MRSGDPQRFAAKVAERRKLLNLTIGGLKAAGGPTPPVVTQAERAELQNPRPSTLSKFDVGLQWSPGSAARVYWDGGEPTVREKVKQPLATGGGAMTVSLQTVLRLMSAQQVLHDLSDKNQPIAPADLRGARDDVDACVSTVAGAFITDLLERNYGEDGSTTHPLLEYAFTELLSPPVSDDDPNAEEKWYRRWLFGKTTDLDPTMIKRFHRRLRAKQIQITREGGKLA
ncbi:XRE family transcriptional regulator [Rhodococcus sp. IEGM 1307]|uniref:XRE family transcriptional regulator n=1 Tax=Rhodococcus sp. IEGM 1307 TaxID=3047091 RepID=UPI0024B7D888|nr:XRE family transcriptional regulator [Rhodococcus sp. IEGM 1307]MDI9979376.1 XRE family transcriptional regulator [Rhodococcus sp. IEGM 1307]